MLKPAMVLISAMVLATSAQAQGMSEFKTGPVFEEYGRVVDVDADFAIPADATFKVLFDSSAGADAGKLNRTLESAARFYNMHARAGVPAERISIAVVLHGKASLDLLVPAEYAKRMDGAENVNLPLIAALKAKGVRIIQCGQSAAAQGITKAMLAPGVEMALSAMTADALLQQEGYTLNPF